MSAKGDRLHLQTSQPKKFRIEYLERITEQFSPRLIIGRGGFGTVYKGKKDNGEFIAVKMLHQTEIAQIDDTQFKKEVLNVLHISHPNIVRLEGYCISKDEELITHDGTHVFAENQHKLICFEYLPNGSLHTYLNNKDKCRAPNWNERYNIIRGICKGLHYLHEGRCGEYILHLDLKPANVLLDKNMMPKIADFGQSRLRLLNEGQTHTTKLVCTREYMPPEYITRGVLSKKTDIYSLGVTIMEIIAGKRKYPDEQLDEVRRKWKEALSASGSEEYEHIEKCIQLGLDCMEEEPEKRLDMKQVIEILGISEDDMNHHPDGIEEHSEERHGLLRRRMMTAHKKSSPAKSLQSSTTAVTVRTESRGMMNCVAIIAGLLIALGGASVLRFLAMYSITRYEMWRTVYITVEEASFTRFALATTSSPSPELTYNISVTIGIDNPSMYVPRITKPLKAAFLYVGQRFHVERLGDEYLTTKLVSMGPMTGNVTLHPVVLVDVKHREMALMVVGQVMYSDPFTICDVQAGCPFRLQSGGTTELELLQKVKCTLHRKCAGYWPYVIN